MRTYLAVVMLVGSFVATMAGLETYDARKALLPGAALAARSTHDESSTIRRLSCPFDRQVILYIEEDDYLTGPMKCLDGQEEAMRYIDAEPELLVEGTYRYDWAYHRLLGQGGYVRQTFEALEKSFNLR